MTHHVKTITEYHRHAGLPKPEHPLVSVIDVASLRPPLVDGKISLCFDFYSISVKRVPQAKFKYGQTSYDFDEGVLFCMAPGQIFSMEIDTTKDVQPTGWMILLHPDFLWNTSLAKSIRQYEFFNYSVNEALYLSDKEETLLTGIADFMRQEYHTSIDKFSQNVITAQLELMLTYIDRYYQRQFITRKIPNSRLIVRVEELLNDYFKVDEHKGLPTVTWLAGELNVTPGYLSEMLKTLTHQTALQHIHNKLIDKAKERLSTTELTVSEIAYSLGFEHMQSFSKLFKAKTSQSPMEFRQSFN